MKGFWGNLEIQDGGPIWPTFRNHDVIPASCDVISSWCGNNFRPTIHPQSFIAVAFIFSELNRGACGPPTPVQKIEKKPGLDRVKH